MNYWHMQLEPGNDKLGVDKLKEILNKNLIGMGIWDEKNGNPQQTSFQKKMNIGDIVLIKKGKIVIGLVRVTSNYFETEHNREDVWFERRRGVEILEILEEPIDDFPDPQKTLKRASSHDTPSYQYIDTWYKQIKRKNKLNIMNVKKLQNDFAQMKSNKEFLFNIINTIEKSDIRQLSYRYEADYENIKEKPVVYLRKKVIDTLINGNLTEGILQSFKEEISKNFDKDVFRSWGEPFRILYTIYFAKYKEDIEFYFGRFINIIQNKLNIKNQTKSTLVHFDGAQNQGFDMIWFAIYNKTYKSQKHAYQLFLSIVNNKFKYGLLHMDDKIKNEVIEVNDLCLKDLIKKYSLYVEKIIKDDSKEKAMITDKVDLLEFKKQIILQGPPGTGKTRLAKQIARFMIKNEMEPKIDDIKEQVKIVQFHPSYSYEDFVRGIVAKSNGKHIEYITEDKLLINISKKAISNPDKKYILIIDEINRANLSSVLGELIYGLEYRGESVESMYADINGDREIELPKNLYIIGTMNTADRSIGHIDYAIRRRFAFSNILSNDNNVLSGFPNGEVIYNKTVELFSDTYISPEFNINDIKIGHSYFIVENDSKEELQSKLEFEIKPLLMEYVKDGILNENAIKIINELSVENDN
ncbi:McrB family protein [Aliarcobacter butzleri]|uniref:McrB family protein n=1 Tax=Aliarcobacter butzleri TaxID=28197 RepID=UPI0021B25692|nr:AAA family ATPase [Aliarcobacter butzleri]MCT7646711.1 AAA family ATPase [Aliarcobacter butzleri]